MARFVAESYEESPSVLSPSVLRWHEGTVTQVARQDDMGLRIQLVQKEMELLARFVDAQSGSGFLPPTAAVSAMTSLRS